MKAVWIVAVFISVLFMKGNHACSCAPAHPQDQFCRAAFVIKASVVSSEYIYKPTAPEPTPEPTSEQMTSYSVYDEQEAFDKGNLAEVPRGLERRPPAVLNGGLIAPMGLNDFPGHRPAFLDEEEDNRPIKLEYTIKVEKIFKGDNYLAERTLAKIYTQPNDGVCGRTDLTADASYIMAGTFYDNELRISTCSWIVPYKSLTRIQRRGVKLMYKKSCGDCTIANCYSSACKFAQPGDNICMFDIANMGNNCESNHSFCSRTRDVCKWQRNRDYKQCGSSTRQEAAGDRFMP